MLYFIVTAVVLFIVVGFIWGLLHLRNSINVAHAQVDQVQIERIEGLCDECVRTFKEKLGEVLDLSDYERSAEVLGRRVDDSESLKSAFGKPDFYWYFVLPVGAYVGELMRNHINGTWHPSEQGGPEMRVPVGDGFASTYPFDKIIKQVTSGSKGDLFAYLMTAKKLEEAVAQPEG